MKFDLNAPQHRKIRKAIALGGTEAGWLWFAANCYCRSHLTDGYIDETDFAIAAPGMKPGAYKRAAEALVAAELWHVDGAGFRVHDFLDWNPSKQESDDAKEKDRRRKRRDSGWIPGEASTRIPDGIPTDSGYREKERESTEKERETARANGSRPEPKTKHAPGALAGSLPRDHIDHGFCGSRFCVKANHLGELIRRYGQGGEGAVVGWLFKLDAGLGPDESPGGWPWICQQFDGFLVEAGRLKVPARTPAAPPSGVPDAEATRRMFEERARRAQQ